MSLPEVTYGFYTATWGGKLSEDDFDMALPHARGAVKEAIGFNSPESPGEAEAFRMAVCACCDVDAAHGFSGGIGAVASASLGSFSYSRGTAGDGTDGYVADMACAVRRELAGTGLLSRVIA